MDLQYRVSWFGCSLPIQPLFYAIPPPLPLCEHSTPVLLKPCLLHGPALSLASQFIPFACTFHYVSHLSHTLPSARLSALFRNNSLAWLQDFFCWLLCLNFFISTISLFIHPNLYCIKHNWALHKSNNPSRRIYWSASDIMAENNSVGCSARSWLLPCLTNYNLLISWSLYSYLRLIF